jgi:hypothetical protein
VAFNRRGVYVVDERQIQEQLDRLAERLAAENRALAELSRRAAELKRQSELAKLRAGIALFHYRRLISRLNDHPGEER